MEPSRADRRRQRTRERLRQAFIALLKRKRYEDISVQDIIERADVARSTFYLHYIDKEDLLLGNGGVFASHAEPRVSPEEHDRLVGTGIFPTTLWFRHIQLQSPILKTIAKDSAFDLAMKNFSEILRQDARARLEPSFPTESPIPLGLVVEYLTNSLMACIQWWVRQDMPYSPEHMDELFQQLVMPSVRTLLEVPS